MAFEAACAEVGRHPSTVGRSAGVVVAPASGRTAGQNRARRRLRHGDHRLSGADNRRLPDISGIRVIHLEFLVEPQTMAALDGMVPVLALLDSN
jgi:hypothetical protein